MQGADGFQESLGVTDQHHACGQQQEHEHRDEDDEHAVPADSDPVELHRDREKGPEHDAPVRAPRRDHRQVFLEGEKSDQSEKHDRHRPIDEDRNREHAHHDPPGSNPLTELGMVALPAPAQEPDQQGREHEQRVDRDQCPHHW